MILRNLIRALQLIDQQGFNLFKDLGKGYSIASSQILDSIAIHCTALKTIIDVGANQGQFALASARKFPNAQIFSFEPLPELSEKFKINLKNHKNITFFNLALGSKAGEIDFYRNDHSHASSALVISTFQKNEIPETARTTKTLVQVDTLDNVFLKRELVSPILLKLDVQGYEKNVLMGGESMLSEIDYLVFEASFVSMYQDEPLFDEMHLFLKEAGYELVAPVGSLVGRSRTILQMDFLYKNTKKNNM